MGVRGEYKVPVIDMNESEFSEKMVKAFQEWGCFRLTNHQIPLSLMAQMKNVAKALLELPAEIKQRNSHPFPGRGYTPVYPNFPYYEGFGVYDVASNAALDEFFHQLNPSQEQRDVISIYTKALHDIAQDMGQKLMKGMGLAGELYEGWPCQFRLNKYNYSSESVGKIGAVMHTDPGFLTVLQDDEIVGGLEIVNKESGELVAMDPIPGSLVINVGDIAKVWSNGRLHNVKHHVQCYEASPRFSIVMFVLGPKDSKVQVRDELVDSEHPRLYVPFDFEEYRSARIAARAPTGGALDLFTTVAKPSP